MLKLHLVEHQKAQTRDCLMNNVKTEMESDMTNYHSSREHRAVETSPFYGLVEPMTHFGEAIYTALSGAADAIDDVFKALAIMNRERKAYRTLSHLDDRTLKDIGIHRSEICHLARRFARAPNVDYRALLK